MLYNILFYTNLRWGGSCQFNVFLLLIVYGALSQLNYSKNLKIENIHLIQATFLILQTNFVFLVASPRKWTNRKVANESMLEFSDLAWKLFRSLNIPNFIGLIWVLEWCMSYAIHERVFLLVRRQNFKLRFDFYFLSSRMIKLEFHMR